MEDLISKRELLERYGVSYGALYRWKRMGAARARSRSWPKSSGNRSGMRRKTGSL